MKNLAKLLTENVNGATFISITTHTDVKLNKTYVDDSGERQPNPYTNRLTKVVEGLNVMVFQNKTTNAYENMVNKRLIAEGKSTDSFTLGPRSWGSRIPNTCFIEHKGQHYIEVICLNKGTTTYLCDGQPIDIKDISKYLPPKSKAKGQGGLSNQVIIRSFKTDSIKSIKVNKQEHTQLYFNLNEK